MKGQTVLVTAAILGAASFDVSRINLATLRLQGTAPLRASLEDVAAPFTPFTGKTTCTSCNTNGPDGVPDLILKFDAQALVASLGAVTDQECRIVQLTGSLLDGTSIIGEDVIVLGAKKSKALGSGL
jgi:hypothetical protein